MKDRLEVICERYNQITEMLSDPSIVSDIKKLTELSKEHNLYRQNYCGCVYSKQAAT